MEMRAEAPAFVPSGPLSTPEADAIPGEVPGDRLIRQLAAAMAPAPSAVRHCAIPAAGLFCPYCAAGGPCSFHRSSAGGWEMQKVSVAGFACMPGGHFRERKRDDCDDCLAGARRHLPPAPTSPPPAPPALSCADASAARDSLCPECGATGVACLCHGGVSAVAHLLVDSHRDGLGKSVMELEDVSTDAGSSDPCCAESDVDAPLAGSSVASRRGRSAQKYAMHSTLPYMSTVWMPNVRSGAGTDGNAMWYSARSGTGGWGTGAR